MQINELIRLNKRLSELGICSRREADSWIEKQWILVNGIVAKIGQRVNIEDKITVVQQAQHQQTQQVTIILNKPIGYVSGQAEKGYKPAIDIIKNSTRWVKDKTKKNFDKQQFKGLAPAGRLDIDSTGILILTQDGRIAKQIIGENSQVEKEYLVRVSYKDGNRLIEKNIEQIFPKNKLNLLRKGLQLDGKELLTAKVDWQNSEQLRFILKEGKKRQIRRMCDLVGLKVIGLKRIRIGNVLLGNLPVGQWRYLTEKENFL